MNRRLLYVTRNPFHLPNTLIYYKNGEWLYNCPHCGENRVSRGALRSLILVPYAAAPGRDDRSAGRRAEVLRPVAIPRASRAEAIAKLRTLRRHDQRESLKAMSWQRHAVRGFIAGAMKKAGYAVESFKPEGGERTYRINSSVGRAPAVGATT